MKWIVFLFLSVSLPLMAQDVTPNAVEQTDAVEQTVEQSAEVQVTIDAPDPGQFPKNPGNAIVWISLIGKWVLDFLGWASALILVLEIMVRKIPSKDNWSIIAKILKFLDNAKGVLAPIFRNVRSGGGYFTTETTVKQE